VKAFPWGPALVSASLCVGCAGVDNPDYVTDSTGAQTGWGCVRGACSTVRESYSPPPPDCEGADTELLVGAGAIAILCAVSVGPSGEDVVHETTCRPLVCEIDAQCPQWTAREYACIEEVCQVRNAGGWELDRVDMTALCLWDVPRHQSCATSRSDPAVVDRLALVDEACPGGTCTSAPDPCLSP
jgi:hypothetical protein